ncbi:FMN-dependent NADH-azoreductase [Xanthomonas indica]|uniref:FMN dependent NADH:quinone oxidoreductase n=2 Tax=Xanthomonas TaxID=338 RepID=A0AAU8I3W6_9XANT|nr:NAD(P)H-dependent oxidoreductase [Xanthomonas indica]MCI2243126.1 NAD(P)H-dependent oxidoreductase [Xanthomonas indica]MCI2263293.1 NAD(P)H-dependent oxidoreductase [Xanthomonas indica]
MTRLLVLNSSINVSGSISRAMVHAYVQAHLLAHPATVVVQRDLVKEPLPAMQPEMLPLYLGRPEQADDAAAALCDALIREVEQADVIVMGLSMYNFSLPASVKAWLDYVVCAGKTFRYTPEGPQGLLPAGKQVIALVASGGIYSHGDGANYDYLLPYLKTILSLIGLSDVRAVRAEGTALGDVTAIREKAIAEAAALAKQLGQMGSS